MAIKHRLVVMEKYDPDGRHMDMDVEECEPGDDCYFNVFAMIKKDLLFGWFEKDALLEAEQVHYVDLTNKEPVGTDASKRIRDREEQIDDD